MMWGLISPLVARSWTRGVMEVSGMILAPGVIGERLEVKQG